MKISGAIVAIMVQVIDRLCSLRDRLVSEPRPAEMDDVQNRTFDLTVTRIQF